MQRPSYRQNHFPHWCTVPVRFRDLDPLNHVNNAIFSSYYEEARIAFIQEMPAFATALANGFSFVLANIEISFIQPVQYPAKLLIGSGIQAIGNTSITSFQAIYHHQTKALVSVAQATGVWFDVNRQRPARVPQIENIEKLMVRNTTDE